MHIISAAPLVTALATALLTVPVLAGSATAATGSPATSSSGQTAVGGPLTDDTTWTTADSPYVLTSEVVVPEGVTLTVEPGVVVSGASLPTGANLVQVSGTVRMPGTGTAPVAVQGMATQSLFASPPTTTSSAATGVLDLSNVELAGPRLLARPTTSTWQPSGAMAALTLRDSELRRPNESLSLVEVRAVELTGNSLVLGTNTTSSLVLGTHETVAITGNRLRGVRVECRGSALTLRDNTFERMSTDAWEDGSGVRAEPGCLGVDARDNHWEAGGDLGSRILDGMDQQGRPVVDVSTVLDEPAPGTPILPPSYGPSYIQIRAYPTGLTAWWASGSTGGAPVTFTAQALPEGVWEPEQTIETPNTGVAFRDLDTSRRYRIRVVAHNAAGVGWQRDTEALQPVETADPPSAPVVDMVRTRGGASLTWHADNGGADLRYYQWQLDGPDGLVEGSGGPDQHRFYSGLQPGGSYVFSVYGVNDIGPGPSSEVAFTAADVPGSPGAVKASPVARRTMTVTWRRAPDNGAEVSSYRVRVVGTRRTVTVDGDARAVRVRRLEAGRRYRFSITAVNEMGSGPAVTTRGTRLR